PRRPCRSSSACTSGRCRRDRGHCGRFCCGPPTSPPSQRSLDRPHDHPYKSIFIFRLPSAVRGKAVKRSRRKSPRRTEADNVTTVRRHAPETVGTADARRRIEERTATHHTACSGNYIKIIFFIFTWLVFQSGIVPVALLAPGIDIPVH